MRIDNVDICNLSQQHSLFNLSEILVNFFVQFQLFLKKGHEWRIVARKITDLPDARSVAVNDKPTRYPRRMCRVPELGKGPCRDGFAVLENDQVLRARLLNRIAVQILYLVKIGLPLRFRDAVGGKWLQLLAQRHRYIDQRADNKGKGQSDN